MDKVFKERETQQFEVVSFDELDRRDGGNWLHRILVGYVGSDLLDEIVKAPDWDSNKMHIQITLNGRTITRAQFQEITNEFANRMLETKIENERLNDKMEAVQHKAESILANLLEGFNDKVYDLNQSLEHLRDASSVLVSNSWAMPYKYTITKEMDKAAVEYLSGCCLGERFTEDNMRAMGQQVFRTMTDARPVNMADNIKVKLPEPSVSIVDIMGIDNLIDMQEAFEKMKSDYVKAVASSLEKAGVAYELPEL